MTLSAWMTAAGSRKGSRRFCFRAQPFHQRSDRGGHDRQMAL